MAIPYTFAGLSGNVPASYLDDNFTYLNGIDATCIKTITTQKFTSGSGTYTKSTHMLYAIVEMVGAGVW